MQLECTMCGMKPGTGGSLCGHLAVAGARPRVRCEANGGVVRVDGFGWSRE